MGIFAESILGAAIAAAVAALICAVKRALRRPEGPWSGVAVLTVLRAQGEAEGLEQAVRSLAGRARGPIYIADAGMSRDALRRAEILAARTGGRIVDGGKFV